MENLLLALSAAVGLFYLRQGVRHLHAISVTLRLADPKAQVPVGADELRSVVERLEDAPPRYARLHIPNGMKPFRDSDFSTE